MSPAAAVSKEQNIMDIKERITHQASELFFRNGIRSVTMNDVADALGISKRTLYEHFSNKEELLVHCIQQRQQNNIKKMEEIAQQASNPVEVIHRHFRHNVILIRDTHPNFARDLEKLHPAIWNDVIVDMIKRRDEKTLLLIHDGMKQGYFRNDTDPEIATKLLFAHVDLLNDTNVFPLDRFSRTDLFRHIVIGFLRSLATEKGLKEIDKLFYKSEYEEYVH